MTKKLFSLFIALLGLQGFSQSDICSGATTITPNATCVYTAGTTVGSSQTFTTCSGTSTAYDVWYKFTATQTTHVITVSPSASFDVVLELYSGSCTTPTVISCMDIHSAGVAETISAYGLAVGTSYFFRVYDYSGSTGTFSVCVTNAPTPPANDACASAISLTPNGSCIPTSGTSYGATQSYPTACGGTPDDDVWYIFTATSNQQVITVVPSVNMNAVVEVLSGSCGTLTSVACIDALGTGGTESAEVALTVGTLYHVRVYDKRSYNGGYPFTICITVPTVGDDPCNAIVLPAVTDSCHYTPMSNVGYTSTWSSNAPTPSSCSGSSSSGAFSAGSHDIWFQVTVPANGNLFINTEPISSVTGTPITDAAMALYSGTCGTLTQIACSDDYGYPGSANNAMPYISLTGLTPGAILYLRYWGHGTTTGDFGFCITSPTNDVCSSAKQICDLNGYKSNTNGYTVDRPSNMRGDAEVGPTYSWTPGATAATGGIFGLAGAWGTGQPNTYTTSYKYDVSIDNNSWITFTASATSASFSISVGDCFSTGGIQMQIFSGNNCTNFTPVSDFKQGNNSFILNANNTLVIGQPYYLMIDGWGGDLCSYTVTANSGVQIPTITAAPATICYGSNTILSATNASVGSTFLWSPGGLTTQTISVSPTSNTTYSCQVSDACGHNQTIVKAITVNPLPTVLVNGSASQTLSICANTTTTLTAVGGTGNSYTWTPTTGLSASTGSLVTITPTSTTNTTYTVTGANASGCKNTGTITIKGLALPSFSITNVHTNTCNNQKDTLTAVPNPAGTYTYTWSNGASTNSITPTINANTVFTATVTDINSCKSVLSSTVTMLALPSISSNTATICNGQSATLTGSGGISYTWTPNATLSNGGVSTTSVTANPNSSTNYTIVGTGANGCINNNATTVNVNSLPNVIVNSTTICAGATSTLIGNGATTYSWSTAQTGSSINVSPGNTTSYTVTGTDGNNCKNTAIATVSVNPVPTINTAPTISPSNCGAATGAITGIGITGIGPLSYTWTNSYGQVVGNTANISNDSAGTYNVHVTDANCSANFGPFNITNPGAPGAPTVTSNTTAACVGQSITVNSSSGASNPVFGWSGPNGFSSSSASFTLNPAQANQSGVYAVTVSSAGCKGPASTITLTIHTLPLINATSSSNAYCSGSTVSLNGSTASTYTWSGPGSYSSNQQNPQIINSTTLTTGIYTLTATDANGCENTDTAKVTVDLTPSLSGVSANSNTLCAGQTLLLNSTVSPATASVNWSGPNGFSSVISNPSIPTITPSQSGTYSVTATIGNCSSSTNTLSILINPTPVATASVSSSLACTGSTVTLTSSGGVTYTWSGPNGYSSSQQNNTLSNVAISSTGIYTLTALNNFGCFDTISVSLTVAQSPTVTSYSTNAANNTVCQGQSIQLIETHTPPSAVINWIGPNGYASPPQSTTFTPTVTGTYTLTATVGSCQSAGLDTIRIIVNPNPVASAIINGSSTVCSGATVIFLGGVSGNTYNWVNTNGVSVSTQQNYTVTNISASASGIYTLSVTNSYSCTSTDTVSLTVNQTPVISSISTNAADNTFCAGQTVQLNATATPPGSPIIWTGPAGFASPPQSTTISNTTPSQSGTYTATTTVGTCTSVASAITITVNPTPTASATASSSIICSGNTLTLNGTGGGSYNWSGPGGSSSLSTYTLTANTSGIYTLVVTNNFNCKDTITVPVIVNPTPNAAIATGAKTCTGGTLTLSATGNGTINWYSDAGLTNLVHTGTTYNPPTASGTTDVYYISVISNNCPSVNSATVSAGNYNIQTGASANIYTGNAPLAVNFSGMVSGTSNPTYSWTLSDNATSSFQNPSHTYTNGGDYLVILTGTDPASLCADTAMLTIHVIDETILIIPNIFTPNGDGINDGFFLTTKGIKSVEGFIMNRWGQMMFTWQGLDSVWDGKAPNGNLETDGVYFYVIKTTDNKGITQEYKGPLTLVR